MDINQTLRQELLVMQQSEQDLRHAIPEESIITEAQFQAIQELDARHTARLRLIIRDYGWPGKHLVDTEGAFAAWLLVQHSPDVDFQQTCLCLMEAALESQDVDAGHVAYLKDRVLIRAGLSQVYGTQYQIVHGQAILFPIEDIAQVDQRRAAVGLESLADYLNRVQL